MKHIFISLLLAAASLSAMAADLENYQKWGTHSKNDAQLRINAGYAIGGTMPMPLPAELREIKMFKPYGGVNVGMEVSKMLGSGKKRWGMSTGAHFFWQGMQTCARVKGYYMGFDMDGEHIEGFYTGIDETNAHLMGFTVPFQAVWRASSRWTLQAGPYLQAYIKKEFINNIYNGYLRENVPTGNYIPFDEDGLHNIPFNDDMRRVTCGVTLTADWKITRNLSAYGTVDWGLNNVFHSDFNTITFNMYNVYANVGLAYSIF